jgi:hypothetical protein
MIILASTISLALGIFVATVVARHTLQSSNSTTQEPHSDASIKEKVMEGLESDSVQTSDEKLKDSHYCISIAIRQDLGMTKGKMAAQASHGESYCPL